MSPGRDPTRGQLDIPLVWETDPKPETPAVATGKADPPRPAEPVPAPFGRLVLAAFADLGVTLLALASAWTVAVAAGVTATTGQLIAIAVVGLEVAAVATCSALWGWRGTPGMLLLDVAFERRLASGAVPRVWLAWLVTLPLGGLPLLVGRWGGRGLERLAGTAVSLRRTPVGA